MSDSVAFFRNLNLGQQRSHSPTRLQLLDAFARAGATSATNVQVNGTVVFATDGDARALAEEVVRLLGPVCGYAGAVLVRPAAWLLDLDLSVPDPADAEVSVFEGPDPFPEPLPWRVPEAGLTVLRADGQHAVSTNDGPRTSGATRALERLLEVPVTSRGVSTIVRLQDRLRDLLGDRPGGTPPA